MRTKIRKAVIILFWLAVWQAAAAWADNSILLVGPAEVLRAFVQNALQPDFLRIVFGSFARIGLGFGLALLAGLLLGALGSRFAPVQELLAPVISTLKSIPVASFVVLLLIWFGAGHLSLFISFLIVFPNVYVNTIAGLKSADEELLEMARVFGMGRFNRFFYLYRPALMPYLNSCMKISLGMSWKSGVAAEVIGLPDYSLGERLYMSKIYLDTAGMFAWTLTVILLSFLFEKAVLRLAEAFAAWKPYPLVTAGSRKEMPGTSAAETSVPGGIPADKKRTASSRAAAGGTDRQGGSAAVSDGGTGRISAAHISKAFGEQRVLADYSLDMAQGGRYLLMAPSGAGKTTFLRILTGLDNADAGSVSGAPARTGMVFQEDRLCEEYDTVCNIMLCMSRNAGGLGTSRAQVIEYVRREASRILPEESLTKPVRELSGGMRRRVALLRAVLSGSKLLVLDEPFTGLDEENRARSAAYLMERQEGRTLVVATHREDDAELLQGEKVALVFSGSLCYNA